MLDKNLIGHSLGKRTLTVEEYAVRFYAKAIGETHAVYHDVAAAREAGYRSLRVPPTFLSCLEGWLFQTRDLLALAKIDLARVLHAEQSYSYHQVICAGDTLTYEPRIVDVYDKKGGALEFLVKETRITNQEGVHVADTRSVLVQRQL
ncbi:MaoC family dehydratase N-terminal domain-containing protein [Cupriavidus necator]|uniref:MaoC family dehydratase n=1 Tax=Cupriavidus necator TaxID=106590 RepID=A0A367PJQ5_CUPNE|nr:MaoC family dehydratase N-terminal domain-containing protein [Cupriavidus necator]QQX82783.1 MaoC family dehydratase N-terminal domain-containing protein [Cupriavidus necator]RCJ07477.1 MaoC family dehydratase [Cupriavidus necator]